VLVITLIISEAYGLQNGIRLALSPQARDLALVVGPLRVTQIFDLTLKDGVERRTPIGNLTTSAAYKMVHVADIEPYINDQKALTTQVLAIVHIPDTVDGRDINGSLCYLEDTHVVQTNVNDGIYLMGKYKLFKTNKDKLGDREVSTIKPKNKIIIGWKSSGNDDFTKQLNGVVAKITKGSVEPDLKVLFLFLLDLNPCTHVALEARRSDTRRPHFLHQLS